MRRQPPGRPLSGVRGRPLVSDRARLSTPRPPRHPGRAGQRDLSLRLGAMVTCLALGFGLLTLRVGQVQVLSADRLEALGEDQRIRTVELPAERGSIFDRNGRELALSVRQQTVWANPRVISDPFGAAKKLAPVLGLDEYKLLERLSRDAAFVYVARKVDDAAAEAVKKLQLPGIDLIPEPERFLPAGTLAQSLIGRVGVDNLGLSGLEVQYESSLAGEPGRVVAERDPRGRTIPGGQRAFEPSRPGTDLVLTIDRSLQHQTEKALASQILSSNADGGTAIVMEVGTGEVLALANLARPTGESESPHPVGPAPSNRALTSVHEPGSVNKMITVAAALEEQLVAPSSRMNVPDRLQVADHLFSDHDPHPTANWSITEILAQSSNIGAIKLGQQLGKERLDHYMRSFGFGAPTGLRFPGESAGILLDTDKYSGTSLATVSLGQGIAVTAMQMLAAYNTIANGGEYVAPKLVRATVEPEGGLVPTPESTRRRVVSEKVADQVATMLGEVVRTGTGELAAVEGYTVAGKTGTARKPKEGARGYEAGAYIASFAGFVPAESPGLAAIVLLDEPKPIYGGVVAAPVFAEVVRYALRHFRIPPPSSGSTTFASSRSATFASSRSTTPPGSGATSPAPAPGGNSPKPAPGA
jgi:cell division protein FtsI (penicillin-binding protein 3)